MKTLSLFVFALLLTLGTSFGQVSILPAGSSEVILADNVLPDTSSVLVFPSTPPQQRGVDITGVRAYADGNMHLFFRTALSEACGGVIRVSSNDPGQESIKTLALAALMSGRAVTVDITPEKSGNFCNLIYIRLDAP